MDELLLYENEFINYYQAKELKELGMEVDVIAGFEPEDQLLDLCYDYAYKNNINTNTYIDAPLKQQVFTWFRRKHFLNTIIFNDDGDIEEGRIRFNYEIRPIRYSFDDPEEDCISGDYQKYRTYNEAEEACLKKLIKILKKKNPTKQ
jgi:hypothetical protein